MGVKVATLRAWRLLRSKKGPPFTRVGRMVMYSMAALEEHIRAGLRPSRLTSPAVSSRLLKKSEIL
jgi:hypothetical protein